MLLSVAVNLTLLCCCCCCCCVVLQVAVQGVEDSMSAGADDHLSKPCTREELMTVIARNYKKQQRI
jgi:FixJ family two-component response regulator